MEAIDYLELLPKPTCPVDDAVSALVEKMPGFMREGLFDSDIFVTVFRGRYTHIMSVLSQDTSKEALLRQLEDMGAQIRERYGCILSIDMHQLPGGTTDERDEGYDVFEAYQRFGEGIIDAHLVIDDDLFEQYLTYLHGRAQEDIQDAMRYLNTLVRFSQVDGSTGCIDAHVRAIGKRFSQEQVDVMIGQYEYLGGPDMTYDEHVDMAMAEPELDDTLESGQDSVAAKDNEITRYEASIIVDTKIEDNARFHLFLAYLWNNAIEPHFTKITKPERQVITNLMNIVRDIIDPEHLVPLVFDNGNHVENVMRAKIFEEGRTLH